jgi:hypothetical protein
VGLLLIGMLAGILVGYGLLAPSQVSLQECPSQGCFDYIAVSPPMQPNSVSFAKNPTTKHAVAVKSEKRSAAKSRRRTNLVKKAHPSANASAPDRIADASDPILNKAKIAIAAKMGDPASAEFSEMKRAMRKNVIGRPVDSICGHVRGKNASGADVGEKPFLYLVEDDDAYVVDGTANSAAAIAYRNICK